MRFIDNNRVFPVWQRTDFTNDEWKFLQRGNNNAGSCCNSVCQLRRVFVYFLHNTEFVFKLVNCVLQLLIQYVSISDDNNAVKNLIVICVMQASQTIS